MLYFTKLTVPKTCSVVISGDSEWALVTVHVDAQGDRQVVLDVLDLVHIVAAIAPDVERTEYKVEGGVRHVRQDAVPAAGSRSP